MFDRLDDTIAAISTAAGSGMRGMIRVSGTQAEGITSQLFLPDTCTPDPQPPSPQRLTGRIALQPGTFVIPAEVYRFRGPRSYTREDTVEFHTASSPPLLDLILGRCLELGARQAAAGEFTARAFFHGGLGIDAVRGIAALIHARSDQQLRAAHHWLGSHLAERVHDIRETLIELLSLVEADIDFAEEPIDFIQPHELAAKLAPLAATLDTLARSAAESDLGGHTPRVVLIGRPNVGKSTLMNRLSGIDRALCSPVAGSTRDFLSAVARMPHGEIELIDTPGWGLRAAKISKKTKNFLERELSSADLVCHLFDLGAGSLEQQLVEVFTAQNTRMLWVANKSDLVSAQQRDEAIAELYEARGLAAIPVSVARNEGVQNLCSAINQQLHCGAETFGDQGVTSCRARARALNETCDALRRAVFLCANAKDMIDNAEYVACDLRDAVSALDELFGEVTTDDLLQRIFEGFCIGK